jgi:hypothetical protein
MDDFTQARLSEANVRVAFVLQTIRASGLNEMTYAMRLWQTIHAELAQPRRRNAVQGTGRHAPAYSRSQPMTSTDVFRPADLTLR